jgi:drug/metabolite transporter (DMT)-like permease
MTMSPGTRSIAAFALTALIWGSTWWVITGQIAGVSAAWSVVWRFALAAPFMALLAVATRNSLRIGAAGQRLAAALGLLQFCGNYNFVYLAERHLTSGIVAVMVGLMLVPNAVLGRALLGQPITRRFAVGSMIALAGIVLLLLNEARTSQLDGNVWLGVALALGGMFAASFANVVQANDTGRALPMTSLLTWAMVWGVGFDVILALGIDGPPVLPARFEFWAGTGYLAVIGSVVTFPLYYGLVREIGAGRAAYNGVAVIIIAMAISTVLEGYRWTALAAGGAVLAMAGLLIALWRPKAIS